MSGACKPILNHKKQKPWNKTREKQKTWNKTREKQKTWNKTIEKQKTWNKTREKQKTWNKTREKQNRGIRLEKNICWNSQGIILISRGMDRKILRRQKCYLQEQ